MISRFYCKSYLESNEFTIEFKYETKLVNANLTLITESLQS
jgi:hypothetical protein